MVTDLIANIDGEYGINRQKAKELYDEMEYFKWSCG